MGVAYIGGFATDAPTGIAIAAISIWVCASRAICGSDPQARHRSPGRPKSYDIPRWISVSVPMFPVDSLYMLLMYVDILILKQYRSPEEIAILLRRCKNAHARFLSSISRFLRLLRTSSPSITKPAIIRNLPAFMRDSIRWTFWPSLLQ